jgi:nucleotide-binding universal stress UspA family protein
MARNMLTEILSIEADHKPKEEKMKTEINKILYATDLSANSAYALHFALDSANLYNAKIVILHALDRAISGCAPIRGVYIDESKYDALFDEHSKETKSKIINRLQTLFDTELKDHPEFKKLVQSIEVREGFPAETILSMADGFNCDMIIMGTHGKGILRNTFIGSTAKRVLRRTRKPVFIIPLPKENSDSAVKDK